MYLFHLERVYHLETVSFILILLGSMISLFTFFFSIILLGYIENKRWIKRVGGWSLLIISFILLIAGFIATPIYFITTLFF